MREKSILEAIQAVVDEFKIPKCRYSLNNGYKENAIGLNKSGRYWEICNFENGQKHQLVEFTNLEHACCLFFHRLASSSSEEVYMAGMCEEISSENDVLEDFKDIMDEYHVSYSVNEDTDIANVFLSKRFSSYWEVYHLKDGKKAESEFFEDVIDGCIRAIYRGVNQLKKDEDFATQLVGMFLFSNALN